MGKLINFSIEAKDVIALFTSGLVTTTLIYTAKNLRLNFEASQAKLQFDSDKFDYEKNAKSEEIRRKKIEYSFQVCSQWYSPAMAVHVELSRSFVRKHADKLRDHVIADFVNELEENLESRRCVISVLNYFENISLLIFKELIDKEIMRDSFKTLFCEYYKVLKPYIIERQKQSGRFLINYEVVKDLISLLFIINTILYLTLL